MKINAIDHFVLTTNNLQACLDFYSNVLGMEVICENGRYALRFGGQKINIHTKVAEFLPAAKNPQVGALDICLVGDEPIEKVRGELLAKGVNLETEIVERNGALGNMRSIYLRDPDGNLIEIADYQNKDA